jgi:anti-anti-sigma factor
MSSDDPSLAVRGGLPPFTCDWGRQGLDAATVQVTGRLDAVSSPKLDRAINAALRDARLVLLNLRLVSFLDTPGVAVIVGASTRARNAGRRVLVVGVHSQAEVSLASVTARGEVEWVLAETVPAAGCLEARSGQAGSIALGDVEREIRPLNNPVNARVVAARVMDMPDLGLWLHDSDGRLHRAWAPVAARVRHGMSLEVYTDGYGAINGWRDPSSSLAINQRRFDRVDSPAIGTDLRCHGPCGVVWRAPAAVLLIEHAERCLTCAGALALD